jgi:hypothetical protein
MLPKADPVEANAIGTSREEVLNSENVPSASPFANATAASSKRGCSYRDEKARHQSSAQPKPKPNLGDPTQIVLCFVNYL